MDNGIRSSIEKPERDWSNAKSLELVFGNKGSVDETMCETGVH